MTHPEAVEAIAKAIRDFRHIPDAGDGYPAIRMGDDTDLARVAVDALVAAGWAPRAEVAMAIAADLLACTVCGQPHGYSRGRTGVQAPIQPGRWDLGADGHFFRPKYLADPRAAAATAREHGKAATT